MAVAELRAQVGDLEAPGEDLALVADVRERVLGEVLDRLADQMLLLARDARQLLDASAAGPPRPRRPGPITVPSRTVTGSPSESFSNSGAPTASTSRTPARARISGPGFG